MPTDKNIEIWGLKEIQKVLDGLPEKYSWKLRSDVLATTGRKTFLRSARDRVPVASQKWVQTGKGSGRMHLPGNLRRSIKLWRYTRKAKYPGISVGPRSGSIFRNGQKQDDGWYAHMIEYGHKRVSKDGSQYGYYSPKPFMRPAFDSNKSIFIKQTGEEFGRVAIRFIKRETRRVSKMSV